MLSDEWCGDFICTFRGVSAASKVRSGNASYSRWRTDFESLREDFSCFTGIIGSLASSKNSHEFTRVSPRFALLSGSSANIREIFSQLEKGTDGIWTRKFTRQVLQPIELQYPCDNLAFEKLIAYIERQLSLQAWTISGFFLSKLQYRWAILLCISMPLIIVSGHQWNISACTPGMTYSPTDVNVTYFLFIFPFFLFWTCFFPLEILPTGKIPRKWKNA